MSFTWPWMLLALLALPALVAWYRRLVRRREARRAALAAQGLVVPAATGSPRRRHLGPALFLAAFGVLVLASARPEATVSEPRREGTVILAFDVSNSMAATDIAPSRMDAAKAAAREFVRRQPSTVRVGVVAFGDSGLVTQRPTNRREDVVAAINRLSPMGGTALGSGLLTSLSAIAGRAVTIDEAGQGVSPDDLGYYGSAAVILLSDGENTVEPDPLELAEAASVSGVRVYPIGLGSPAGTVLKIDDFMVATALDEKLLRQIATTTDGRYFRATDQRALAEVYDSIDPAWTIRARRTEVTGLFSATAGVLLLAGALLSLRWYGRVL